MTFWMSDFGTDSNLFLMNFSCELAIIMTRYDFPNARVCDFEKCLNRLALDIISLLVKFMNFGQDMTSYMILSNIRTDCNLFHFW